MVKNRALLTILAATTVASLAVGCSGDSPNTGSSPDDVAASPDPAGAIDAEGSPEVLTPDPCALLTLDELSGIFGDAWSFMEELPQSTTTDGVVRTCWYAVHSDTIDSVSVGLSPINPALLDSYRAVLVTDESDVVEIDGIGDAAWREGSILWVANGSLLLTIMASYTQVAPETLITLAELALPRMP